MREHDGAWVGWPGAPGDAPEPFEADGMHLVPVADQAEEIEDYYEGFSQRHALAALPRRHRPAEFHRPWWEAYVAGQPAVRRRRRRPRPPSGATVWVHDYQLQLVPGMLRELRPDLRIGFFIHIPFPPLRDLRAAARGAGRSSRACSAPTCSASSARPTPTTSCGPAAGSGADDPPGRRRRPGTPAGNGYARGTRGGVPDLDRRGGARPSSPAPRTSASGPRRSATSSATRASSCSASTGSTTPRASCTG